MPYPVKSVVNAIIQKARANGTNVSPLKLQKLLYYVCGYYVASRKEPLIDHTFEAWDYGPVVPEIYRHFRRFGNSPITTLATDHDWDTDALIAVPPPDGDRRFEKVLDFVWSAYGKYSAVQLSEMTHRAGTPWDQTRRENPGIKDADIPRQTLIEYFGKFIKKKKTKKSDHRVIEDA